MRILTTAALQLAAALSGRMLAAGGIRRDERDRHTRRPGDPLSDATVPPGRLTFSVKNAGSVVDNLVLLRTDVPQNKLPADPQDASKVKESVSLATTAQLAAGESKTFTRELASGSYVLICSEPGHYLMGMHTAFTVK